jgi:hypothetical protein
LATAIRTAIILFITWGIVFVKGNSNGIISLSKNNWIFFDPIRLRYRYLLVVLLQGITIRKSIGGNGN